MMALRNGIHLTGQWWVFMICSLRRDAILYACMHCSPIGYKASIWHTFGLPSCINTFAADGSSKEDSITLQKPTYKGWLPLHLQLLLEVFLLFYSSYLLTTPGFEPRSPGWPDSHASHSTTDVLSSTGCNFSNDELNCVVCKQHTETTYDHLNQYSYRSALRYITIRGWHM